VANVLTPLGSYASTQESMDIIKVRTQQEIAILRLIARGHSYAQIVDHLPGVTYHDIFAAAGEALKAMEGGQTQASYVETVRQTHQRAY